MHQRSTSSGSEMSVLLQIGVAKSPANWEVKGVQGYFWIELNIKQAHTPYREIIWERNTTVFPFSLADIQDLLILRTYPRTQYRLSSELHTSRYNVQTNTVFGKEESMNGRRRKRRGKGRWKRKSVVDLGLSYRCLTLENP